MELKTIFTDKVHWPAGTSISFPGDDTFSGSTKRWTVYRPPSYAIAISPSTEQAVAQVVELAASHNVPFLATGGRHGYSTTFGKLQNGVAIDLSRLDSIEINASAATMTIGGGVTIGDIIDPLYQNGVEIQTGSCSCVGMVGATLGAGVGRYQGIHGLIIDALLSVRLVTADGKLVTVSEESNPDLFWGIRGAGANFGVITSATYKIHKLTNDGQVLNADFVFPGNVTSAYFKTLKAYGTLPAELIPTQGFFWDAGSNSTILMANWLYVGPEEKGRELMAPIFALNPVVQSVSVVPYNQLIQTTAFGVDASLGIPGRNLVSYTVNVKQLSVTTFEWAYNEISEFLAKYPDGRNSSAVFETFPNAAVNAVPVSSTSYPWRSAVGNFLFQFAFPKHDSTTEAAAKTLGCKLRDRFVATSGYPSLAVYTSYAGGDETLEQIFGHDNLPRLVALKKQWDPTGVFNYQNALSTQYPGHI
ncbi:Glucooligosaccharide oxidase [Xylariaceae sp. AK1471]|nr:Glucooligosaccharide oxidase [Xylariaceae sp. AK1471]